MYFAHKVNGVKFKKNIKYIHPSAVIDPSAEVFIGDNVVVSTGVLILSHDYSITVGYNAINKPPKKDIAIISAVKIGDNCFIGANTIILPGSVIGDNVIIGAGSVVKGKIDSNSVIAGNLAKKIMDVREWMLKKDEMHEDYLTSKY